MITRRRSTCQRERARVKPWKVRRHLGRLCLGWETWLEHAGTWRMSLLVSLCGSSFPILGPVFPLFSQKLRGSSNAWSIFWEAQKNCKFEFKLLICPFEKFQESRCSSNLLDGCCQCFFKLLHVGKSQGNLPWKSPVCRSQAKAKERPRAKEKPWTKMITSRLSAQIASCPLGGSPQDLIVSG